MILDTSFLIDLFAGQPEAFDRGRQLVADGIVQRVPSPVVMELTYGAAFADEDERRAVRNALLMYPVVEQDAELAGRAGALLAAADIDTGGESGIDTVDPMVAAVADRFEEPVMTADIEDFRALGVAVEAY